MARDFAKQFYKSKRWQRTREAYLISVNHLCESCQADGLIEPAEIVHHIINLSPNNINNEYIALGFDNLKAVCRKCHAAEHDNIYNKQNKRYKIDKFGNIEMLR